MRKKDPSKSFKRYCKTLTLEENPELIAEYKEVHQQVWPEISKGMREVGILDMEIYIHDNHLFMIMDTLADFDHEQAMKELAQKPRQAEWEAYVSKFQQTTPQSKADDKWQLMERIFKLNEDKNRAAEEGQLEECPS